MPPKRFRGFEGALGRGIFDDVKHFLDAVGQLQGSEQVVDSEVQQTYNRGASLIGGGCMI